LPGLSAPTGSKRSFTASNISTVLRPYIFSWNSERASPSPCSPECAPLYSRTMANASSAMARMVRASFSSLRFSTGRTCRQPTLACAYQVPLVPCFSNTAVRRSV
jgi:hypothetical protein